MESKRKCPLYSFSLVTYKHVIKKHVRIRNVVFSFYCIDKNADHCTKSVYDVIYFNDYDLNLCICRIFYLINFVLSENKLFLFN